MSNKFYKIKIIFSLLLIFMSVPTYAKVSESNIPVTYNISENDRYDLKINVIGNGTVYDGSKSIRNGTIVHQLKVSEKKIFKIIPDNDSFIKQIIWQNKNTLLNNYYNIKPLKNGKELFLTGVSTDSELTIEFDSNNNINSSNNIDNPKTGDNSILIWIILLISSFILIFIFKFFNSKEIE